MRYLSKDAKLRPVGEHVFLRSILFTVAFGFYSSAMPGVGHAADSVTDALKESTANVDARLRYESVEQDNALEHADSLTLRTRIGLETSEFKGFSGVASVEDVRHVLGVEGYSLAATGFKTGEFSTIADPETTELDQAYLQYQGKGFTTKVGTQVITHDNQRFVGHVGWRQDRQTFDALTLQQTLFDDAVLSYHYIGQRRLIFAEAADLDSEDHLFHAVTSIGSGKLSAYAYLLEVDDGTDNGLDTYGARYAGEIDRTDLSYLYAFEFATQTSEATGVDNYADYYLVEGGLKLKPYWLKVGYEVLGSDDGIYGFSTPLATLHAFNGWADQFLSTPSQGLEDLYVTVGADVMGGIFMVTYHDFDADDGTATIDDLGSELDLMYEMTFGKHYHVGVKYAAYNAGDVAAGKVDTDKLDIWVGLTI